MHSRRGRAEKQSFRLGSQIANFQSAASVPYEATNWSMRAVPFTYAALFKRTTVAHRASSSCSSRHFDSAVQFATTVMGT
jgi:hypothetical protein